MWNSGHLSHSNNVAGLGPLPPQGAKFITVGPLSFPWDGMFLSKGFEASVPNIIQGFLQPLTLRL